MLWMIGLAAAGAPSDVDKVLDTLHQAATMADADAYFGLFADNAVFIGTDPTERWDLERFKAFAEPHFEAAPAWSYTPVERHVEIQKGTAWFDEVLEHAEYGRVRGSGVLVRKGRTWRIAQYVLSFAIPNEVARHTIAATQGEAWLPTPFTAAQIRDAMPAGAFFRHRVLDEGGEQITTWRVLEADDESVSVEYGVQGGPEPRPATHRWVELRDHARFSAPHTTWEPERIETPAGTFDCRRYTVTADGLVKRFWFAHAAPGAPVRMVVTKDDVPVTEMELLERTLPGAD